MLLLSSVDFFSKLTFSKKNLSGALSEYHSLDPDQDQHSVGPDLAPNCLQIISADDKICR